MQTRISEVLQIAHALSELMNVEFARAWGEPGVPGEDTQIVSTCRLFSGTCLSAVEWEEAVRFANVDEAFEEVRTLLVGVAGSLIDEAAKVPEFLAGLCVENEPTPGVHRLSLTLELPDGWNEAVEVAFARAAEAFLADM